jgi:hypothetical protein
MSDNPKHIDGAAHHRRWLSAGRDVPRPVDALEPPSAPLRVSCDVFHHARITRSAAPDRLRQMRRMPNIEGDTACPVDKTP